MLTSVRRGYVHATAAVITITGATSAVAAVGVIPMPTPAHTVSTRVAAAARPVTAPAVTTPSPITPGAGSAAPSGPDAGPVVAASSAGGSKQAVVAATPVRQTEVVAPPRSATAPSAAPQVSAPAAPSGPARSEVPQVATPAPIAVTTVPATTVPATTVPTPTSIRPTTASPTTAVSGPAPRTQPSAAAVQQAIAGLGAYVQSVISPTPSQVAQVGNLVCTAFDQGHTYSQVAQQVQSELTSLPLTTVRPGASAYVVATTVDLYCPAYAPKVG